MSDEILSLIYTFSKKFSDPETNLSFDPKNQNISAVVKDGNVNISLLVKGQKEDLYLNIARLLKNNVEQISGILSVNVIINSDVESTKTNINEKRFKIDAKNIVAIASGKGGVGKSTFSVNLATALSSLDLKIGLLDADIYGPSIPRMMGLSEKPKTSENKKLIPLEKYNIKCMSIGFLIDPDTPTIWRGPMVIKALEQMFNGVEWGTLDYLIIDLPPGTGDAQLSLAQNTKLTGSIIVSTPQDVALIDARKGINMFKKVNVPILGLVENMSYFICDNCEQKHHIFLSGGAKKEAENFNIRFLGELPLDKNLCIDSDRGKPVNIGNKNSSTSELFKKIAIDINNIVTS